jgi:transcriptional regulator NrdR family protein
MSEIKLVLKSDGTTEPFNGSKLKNSLTSTDASVVLANEITDKIKRKLSGVTSTEDIYNLAFKLIISLVI